MTIPILTLGIGIRANGDFPSVVVHSTCTFILNRNVLEPITYYQDHKLEILRLSQYNTIYVPVSRIIQVRKHVRGDETSTEGALKRGRLSSR